MSRPSRPAVFLYAQHLTGSGHHVRFKLLADAIARQFDVWHLDGGRPVPWRAPGPGQTLVRLPRVFRRAGVLAPLDPQRGLADVMRERSRILKRAVAESRPAALLVEHFPLGKWVLEKEISALIDRVRAANPAARIICSIRESNRPSRPEATVLGWLERHFDAVLVHSDLRLASLADIWPPLARLSLPIHFTGLVSRPPAAPPADHLPYVVASMGGSGRTDLVRTVQDAWSLLQHGRSIGCKALHFFGDLGHIDWPPRRCVPGVRYLPFSEAFHGRLAGARVSISQAGYNTCVDALQAGCPSVLLPRHGSTDQLWRARRLAERGLARSVLLDPPVPEALAEALVSALEAPRIAHDLDLEGASNTASLLSRMIAAAGSGSRGSTDSPGDPVPRLLRGPTGALSRQF